MTYREPAFKCESCLKKEKSPMLTKGSKRYLLCMLLVLVETALSAGAIALGTYVYRHTDLAGTAFFSGTLAFLFVLVTSGLGIAWLCGDMD